MSLHRIAISRLMPWARRDLDVDDAGVDGILRSGQVAHVVDQAMLENGTSRALFSSASCLGQTVRRSVRVILSPC